jgi:hypothetical protein
MTDYFALLDEARRPWLDPEKLKEKYHRLSRAAPPDAEINEAFRVLGDPKLRLHHLLILEGADLAAGRPVPPAAAELFWNTGTELRDADRWLLKYTAATTVLGRALLKPERAKLEERLHELEEQLRAAYESELTQLRQIDDERGRPVPNELSRLIELYDCISYLTRLLERTREKRFELTTA